MSKTSKIIVALIFTLTLILGSVGMVGAAPAKTKTIDVEITKVVNQSIYYSIKWANQEPVLSYYFEVSYEYIPGEYICLFRDTGDNPTIVNLDKAKSRLGIKGTFNSIDPTYTIKSGDKVKIFVRLFSGADSTGNTVDEQSMIYTVP